MKTEYTGKVAGRVAKVINEMVGKETKYPKITAVIDCTPEGAKYPVMAAVIAFGKNAGKLEGIQQGDEVEVKLAPSSREFNGRWSSDLNVDAVRVVAMAARPADAEPVGKADNGLDAADDAAMPF